MPEKRKNELKMAREGKTTRILVQGVIGWDYWGTSARGFRQDLNDNVKGSNTIELEIDSPGGIVTEGIAMANAIMEQDAAIHTYVSGEAASMGSILLMAGDKLFIPANAMVMVHKPLNGLVGNADDMRKQADTLDKFEKAMMSMYMRHFKGSEEEMGELMAAETWLTADDMEAKFNNVVVMRQELQAVACTDPISIFKPEAVEPQEREIVVEEGAIKAWISDKLGINLGGGGKKAPVEGKQVEQEEDMTPEEKADMEKTIAKSVTEGVMTALKEQGVIKAEVEDPKKPKAVEVEFEGEKSDPEAVAAHLEKVKAAKLEASTDWNDPKSIQAYYDAISGQKPEPKKPAGSNTEVVPAVLGLVGNDTKKMSAEAVKDTAAEVNSIRGIK